MSHKQGRVHAFSTRQVQHSSAARPASLTCLSLTGGTEAIVIKPAEDSAVAQAALAEWPDLALYARGITERQAAIPPGLLSLPNGLTPLPLEPPPRFVAEPYVATDKCVHSPLIADPWMGCHAVCTSCLGICALCPTNVGGCAQCHCPISRAFCPVDIHVPS